MSAMNNPQKISPTVYLPVDEIETGGKTILHVYIPESSQVHNTNRRIFDRNEDGDFDITDNTDLVAACISESNANTRKILCFRMQHQAI